MSPAVHENDLALDDLTRLLRGGRIAALTGAGCSTESGIPDYRGPTSVQRARAPVQYQEFMRSEHARQRYWARSTLGWPRIARARPNCGHEALALLEARGALHGIITQNVDGLHHAAGSGRVVELHGSLAQVRCMTCGERTARAHVQERILALNASWFARVNGSVQSAPDGDADLDAAELSEFQVPACSACGGVLKPDVVFFGENVPRAVVDDAWRIFDACDVLLVIGSSLPVYSGRRFVDRAAQLQKPIAVINIGPTRADDVAAVKLDAPIGSVLSQLAASLA